MFRVGLGEDSHAFDPGSSKPLVLGGVLMEGHGGFKAHSDGDVILHALFNSISTALGLRSIGYHFPDTLEENRNRSSWDFLGFLRKELDSRGFEVVNISIMVLAKEPKIEPVSENIRKNISTYFGIGFSCVGLAATSGEGMDDEGRGKGVYVSVSCLLQSKPQTQT